MRLSDGRNHGLDLMRGLCAVGVAVFHHISWTYGVGIESIGAFGVYAFFILSATTMMLVYAPQFHNGITRDNASNFYRNRAARIMPLLALVSAITFVWLIGLGAPFWPNLQKAILTGTGALALGTAGLLSGVTGAWSLGIELVFYAIFPIVALYSVSASTKSLAYILAAAFLAQHMAMSLFWGFDLLNLWYNYATSLTFTPYFIAGLLIFRLNSDQERRFLFISLFALGMVFCFSMFSKADLYRSPMAHGFLSIVTGLAGWAAYRSAVPGRLVPIATFLGEISYALYLIHFLANWLADIAFGRTEQTKTIRTISFVLISLALSYTINIYFEKPMRRFFRKPGALRATKFWRRRKPFPERLGTSPEERNG